MAVKEQECLFLCACSSLRHTQSTSFSSAWLHSGGSISFICLKCMSGDGVWLSVCKDWVDINKLKKNQKSVRVKNIQKKKKRRRRGKSGGGIVLFLSVLMCFFPCSFSRLRRSLFWCDILPTSAFCNVCAVQDHPLRAVFPKEEAVVCHILSRTHLRSHSAMALPAQMRCCAQPHRWWEQFKWKATAAVLTSDGS